MSYFEIDTQLSVDTIKQLWATKQPLALSAAAKQRIAACRQYVDDKMQQPDAVFYGINTGFGSLCNTRISHAELESLQYNLLRSHACGTGKQVSPEIVKLMLLLKIQSLAYGHSGVQVETVERLIHFYNNDVLPLVYEQGSLGASGDLAPLAHLCLPLIGEGEVMTKQGNTWIKQPAKHLGLAPIRLKSKEGLALINGTQFMLAFAVWCVAKAEHLYNESNKIAAISIDAFDCKLEPFHHMLHQVRPHTGQLHTANQILQLLQGSAIAATTKQHVQDPYSFRCIPQVHGATFDTIRHVKQVIETELCSVTDNPNVFPQQDLILSGGNFHGQPLALVLDFLAIAVAELGSISERRTYQLISGQRGLPPFLTSKPGSHSGMMIPQYTAASIVSRNKQLCTPASVDSIVSSNGQEDHVSMGANAAVKCKEVVENVQTVLAIELLNAAQALEFRRPLQSSAAVEEIVAAFRQEVSALGEDRILSKDIHTAIAFLDRA